MNAISVENGETPNGNKYVEFRVAGKKRRVIVQENHLGSWHVYVTSAYGGAVVSTLASFFTPERELAVTFGRGVAEGLRLA